MQALSHLFKIRLGNQCPGQNGSKYLYYTHSKNGHACLSNLHNWVADRTSKRGERSHWRNVAEFEQLAQRVTASADTMLAKIDVCLK